MTTLVKWTPFRELDLMERRMRRMLEDVGFGPYETAWATGINLSPTRLPTADVYETPEEFIVELEVPGFEEKELGLEVTDHTLTIRGEVKAEKEETEKTYLLHERLERHFERRFQLPEDADTDKLVATFESGVLEIHAPKAVEAKPRKVLIEPVKPG